MKMGSLLLALLLCSTVGGAFATLKYALQDLSPSNGDVGFGVQQFEFAPENILPGGGHEEVELGGDHYGLIDLILNENDKGYGLNINNNVVLHQYLRRQPVVFSNQKVSGGNLKFILDPQNNTHGLYYCLEKETDTQYYAYTFSVAALEEAAATGGEIAVYKTALVKTDLWRATVSYFGYAYVRSLSTFDVSADPKSVPYSIDVGSFHA